MTVDQYHFFSSATGLFSGASFSGSAEDAAAQALHKGEGIGIRAGAIDYLRHRVDIETGAVVSYQPPAPVDDQRQAWHWDLDACRWVSTPTIAAVREAAWERIKAERDRRLSAGFTVAGRHYQVNQAAMSGATLAACMALMQGSATAADYRQAWVLADNSAVSLTAPEMIAVGLACKALSDGLWTTSQYLRGVSDAATTTAQVEAITWP